MNSFKVMKLYFIYFIDVVSGHVDMTSYAELCGHRLRHETNMLTSYVPFSNNQNV